MNQPATKLFNSGSVVVYYTNTPKTSMMDEIADTSVDAGIKKQADISLVLSVVILFLVVVFMACTYSSANESTLYMVLIAPVITVLSGCYMAAYKADGSRAVKVVFITFLIISIVVVGIYLYLMELGRAYAH